MAEGKTRKTWSDRWEGLKAEFGKIIWPTKNDMIKQTTAVIVVSVIFIYIILYCWLWYFYKI